MQRSNATAPTRPLATALSRVWQDLTAVLHTRRSGAAQGEPHTHADGLRRMAIPAELERRIAAARMAH